MAGRWASVHTSDAVVVEALDFVRRRIGRRGTETALLELVFGADDAPPVVGDVARVHAGRFEAALDLFRRTLDDGLTFTDCTTLVLMQELGIGDLATFDGGFGGRVHVVDEAEEE